MPHKPKPHARTPPTISPNIAAANQLLTILKERRIKAATLATLIATRTGHARASAHSQVSKLIHAPPHTSRWWQLICDALSISLYDLNPDPQWIADQTDAAAIHHAPAADPIVDLERRVHSLTLRFNRLAVELQAVQRELQDARRERRPQ